MNITQASLWLDKGQGFTVQNGQFVKDDLKTQLLRKISPAYNKKKVEEVAVFLLQNVNKEFSQEYIKKYSKISSKSLQKLDSQIHTTYLHAKNIADLKRWEKWGFDPEIFHQHKEFARFLLDTRLGSQMKIFKDPIIMKNGVPGIRVGDEWYNIDNLKKRFSSQYSPAYREEFIVDKDTMDVYTYLDNGKGLQKHHPYLEKELLPITRLTDDEYSKTLEAARKFDRGDNKNAERTYVFQVVSSYFNNGTSNAAEMIKNRQHPWVRIICGSDKAKLDSKKGDVYEVGFGWKASAKFPGFTSTGQFRTEDFFEYKTPDQRIVTSIPITETEAKKLFKYVNKYHAENINLGKEIGFNMFRQNCSAFVHHLGKEIGVKLPTKIYLTDLAFKISPDFIQKPLVFFENLVTKLDQMTYWVPAPVKRAMATVAKVINEVVSKTLGAIIWVVITPISIISETSFGKKAQAFIHEHERKNEFKLPVFNYHEMFQLKNYYFHLPGVLQEWQLTQPSTVTYKEPVKICIAP